MEKIKILELFSGYGSQKLALDYLGIPCESTQCEIDKYAVDAYNQIHGETENLGDICKIDETKLPYYDLITYSSPCFTGDTLVMTTNGYKQIKDIKIGDSVITHTGTFKQVRNVFNNGLKDIVKIKSMGVDEIKCTTNHKFYVREKKYRWENKGRVSKEGWKKKDKIRYFDEPKWVEAKDLTKNHFLGIPLNTNEIIPEWNGIDLEWADGRKTRHKNELSKYMDNNDFWWLIGRYLGDGWCRSNGGIIICTAHNEVEEVTQVLDRIGLHYNKVSERTVTKVHIAIKEIGLFCSQFGKGALNKHLTGMVFDLPKELLKSFIVGYLSADGSHLQTKYGKVHRASSISRELIYGISMCIMKAYHTPVSLYKENKLAQCNIEGRIVNQHSGYQIRFNEYKTSSDKAFYEEGYIWVPFKNREDFGKNTVYDIEVDTDHSFTANNIIVHNCQDFSVAGLQKGGDKDSGTRSSLLWECERIIKAVKPKYLLMENVKNLVGKQHKHNFIAWLDTLDALGYNNYWQVLNAKDYGVPQNRERVFVVSIRKDIQQGYTFPEKIPLEKRLKDILEDSVDEKYYLSDRMVNFFIKNSEDNAKKGNGFRFTPQFGETYARAVTTNAGSRMDDNFIKEPICASSRGRNPENPSDRTVGIYLEQTLEFNKDGCTNTLTTVQKDNYIVEPKIIQRGHGFNKGGEFEEAPTITANGKYQENNFIVEPLAYDEQNDYIRQDGCVGTLTTDGSSPKHNNRVIEPNVIQLGNIVETGNWDNPQRGRIYSADGCSPALNTMQGGGLEPKILESYVEKQYNKFIDENGGIYEYTYKRIHTLLRILWREIRTKEIWKEVGGFQCVQKEKILFSGMYEEGYGEDREIPTNIFNSTLYSKDNKSFIVEQNFLRDMWERIKTRRASQRWGLSKQQFREFACCMQKLSQQVTQTEEEMCYLWKTNESLRVLRQTLSEIQKIWKSFGNQQRTRTLGYRIRKLTPRECWRLQGVKDEDFNKLHDISNTQLYKMAGNSIVADVLVAIFRNLFINKTEYVKKGNLFNL